MNENMEIRECYNKILRGLISLSYRIAKLCGVEDWLGRQYIRKYAKGNIRSGFPEILSDDKAEYYPPFICTMNSTIRKGVNSRNIQLPVLDKSKTIAIFSDYAGEENGCPYRTYSFLLCSWDDLGYFFTEAINRRNMELGVKEIKFTSLGYGPVKRALKDYLKIYNNLVRGLLVTIIVESDIVSMFGTDENIGDQTTELLECFFKTKWKKEPAERMLRIVHFASYFAGLLGIEGKNVLWMTDNDRIAENPQQKEAMGKLFVSILSAYLRNLRNTGIAFPFQERDPKTMDLVSLADLAAGSVAHYFKREQMEGEFLIKEGAKDVLQWLSFQGVALKRIAIAYRQNEAGVITCSRLSLKSQEIPENMRMI